MINMISLFDNLINSLLMASNLNSMCRNHSRFYVKAFFLLFRLRKGVLNIEMYMYITVCVCLRVCVCVCGILYRLVHFSLKLNIRL